MSPRHTRQYFAYMPNICWRAEALPVPGLRGIFFPTSRSRQGAIRGQFVEHKRLEKSMAKLSGDIQALEVPDSKPSIDHLYAHSNVFLSFG